MGSPRLCRLRAHCGCSRAKWPRPKAELRSGRISDNRPPFHGFAEQSALTLSCRSLHVHFQQQPDPGQAEESHASQSCVGNWAVDEGLLVLRRRRGGPRHRATQGGTLPDRIFRDMCGRPFRSKRNLQERCGTWSGADMCSAFAAARSHAAGPDGSPGSGPIQARALEALVA